MLLFYGMTYLMILEKLPILTNLKTFYYLGMEMNANVRGQVIIPTAHCSDNPFIPSKMVKSSIIILKPVVFLLYLTED
jgi:hypothetical protein